MRSIRENLKLLDGLTRAAGSLEGVRGHVKALVKESVDHLVTRMDLVSRAEFERVETVAQKARLRQEALEKRLTSLERQLKAKRKTKK